MTANRTKRRGLTLVELLAVIAILGMLIGLLLPAVQFAREAARRTTCKNNLKQMGLALASYETLHGHFPSGYLNEADTAGWGWGTMLLPYMEQGAHYDAMKVNSTNFDGVPTPFTQRVILTYVCPSDRGPNINDERGGHAKSNYAGVFGTDEIESWNQEGNGVFFVNSDMRLSSITDGLSATFAIGERRFREPQLGAIWVGKFAPEAFASNIWSCVHSAPHRINGTKQWAFSSEHSGGAHFLMCDGAVDFYREDMNAVTYRQLAQRDDGGRVTEGGPGIDEDEGDDE